MAMSEEILINVTPMETRVAVVENGMAQEVYIERTQHKGIVGNIYKGKVVRVLPGMQAAFVDIGLERAAFIHTSDFAVLDADGIEQRGIVSEQIRDLVREGEELIVQVVKDPLGTKGVGEAGAIPTGAAFAQAIEDALGGSIEITEIPLNPNRLFELMTERGSAS